MRARSVVIAMLIVAAGLYYFLMPVSHTIDTVTVRVSDPLNNTVFPVFLIGEKEYGKSIASTRFKNSGRFTKGVKTFINVPQGHYNIFVLTSFCNIKELPDSSPYAYGFLTGFSFSDRRRWSKPESVDVVIDLSACTATYSFKSARTWKWGF